MYRNPVKEKVAEAEVLAGVELLKKLVAGGREGPVAARQGRLPGQGDEFYGHRPYYEGDDLRRVDWHAFQRTGHTYIKEMTRGIEGRLAMVVDASASMCFGEPTRFTLARRTALLLAGAVAEDAAVRVIVTGKNERVFDSKGLEELAAFLEDAEADTPGERSPGILERHAHLLYGKGLVAFLGDFYSEAEAAMNGAGITLGRAPSATGVAVRFLAPADMGPQGPQGDGEIELRGVEGEGGATLAWSDRQAERYRREWENVTRALREELASAGVRMLDAAPGEGALDIAIQVLAAGGLISS